jgi:hypothetical protein
MLVPQFYEHVFIHAKNLPRDSNSTCELSDESPITCTNEKLNKLFEKMNPQDSIKLIIEDNG